MASRGKLLTYDPTTGNGVVALMEGAGAERIAFTIDRWKSSELPRLGMVVDVVAVDDKVQFTPVAEGDLVREKIEHLGRQVSGSLEKTMASHAAGSGAHIAIGLIDRISVPIVAAYILYALGATFGSFINFKVLGMDIPMTLAGMGVIENGYSSVIKALFWASMAAPFVPLLFNDRRSWYVCLAPLLAVAIALIAGLQVALKGQKSLGELGAGTDLPPLGAFYSLGLGFYLCVLAAAAITMLALRKTRAPYSI